MGDMERRRSARCFTRGCRPKLPPMRKASCEAPAEASCASFFESASLLSSVPSMHRAMTAPPLGSFSSMSAASLASACSISAGAGD